MSFHEQHRDFIEELERIAPEGVRIGWSGDTLTVQASPSNIHRLNIAPGEKAVSGGAWT
ncbi:hypothetical protein [Kitasatospora sp. NPDC008115]|uniref:hypothetical protein n=1 Tax=Kitasatospora sp. NPDC008115 TaxID=3364022 RepID=UPI0036E89EF4